MGSSNQAVAIATIYKFVTLDDPDDLKDRLQVVCNKHGLKGTLLLAREGLNGTVAGTVQDIDALLFFLRQDPRFSDLQQKRSFADDVPFYRMKIKIKKEVVSMGVPGTDPACLAGNRVNHKQWNELITNPEVLVIDTRNDYEYKIGTFEGAVSPRTKTFREFPGFVDKELDPDKHKKVAIFCTGGIRCEKASNYLLQKDFQEVYHLDGGILKYLEEINKNKEQRNLWRGECFVFDGRVAVDKHLQPSSYEQCFACRMPLSSEDLQSDDYVRGISCSHCIRSITDKKHARYSERQRQVELAERRQQQHIGVPQSSGSS